MEQFYAKSNGETIEEHTSNVLKAFEKLSKYLLLSKEEKWIIEKLINYHDLGKINPEFQNRMRRILRISNLLNWHNVNVPHEWLSPAFITQQEEKEIKDKLSQLGLDKDRFFNIFIFTILSHHHRENQIPNSDLIKSMIEWIKNNFIGFQYVEYYYDCNNLFNTYNTSENKELWNLFFIYRVKWLGSLLKCDYCASADIEPEEKYNGNYHAHFQNFLKIKQFELKEFQKKAVENSNKSIILVASTGMGKTEAAMNWINGQKAFYLLGIRVAVNEMYKRFKNIFGDNVTLLHGETSYSFAQQETDEDEYETKIEKARKLSYPLTIATADQLITSVFKYPGFEFTYLTCSYSKIVLDEIQSFSPSAIAAIVVFLKEIHELGGRFMLMTATLPPFLKDEFSDLENICIFEPQLLNIYRHKISIVDEDIQSKNLLEILKNNTNKKILIICNTVKKTQEMFEFLKNNGFNSLICTKNDDNENISNLIHSQFIGKDKKEKEVAIMKTKNSCIWVSTQVIEASLDIDFDLLLTENASIESLLQRFGRCYRKREYSGNQPNIYIFKSQPYNIYDPYLFQKTWEVIQKYNNKLLSEDDKQNMINEVFDNIAQTNYFTEYKKQKDLLEIGYRSLSKIEAQEDFRQITNNYIIIPEPVFNNNQEKIKNILFFIDNKNNDRLERIKKQAEFFDYTISLQLYGNINNILSDIPNSQFCKKRQIKILKGYGYSKEKGLFRLDKINQNSDNII
ncbi:MAG: CRISPR-associated helicase Cas3' [Spirochaetota bacterium]|nr:CRISPR-associated helicase Cas3' [Spirochaetota bacterium]